MPRCGSKRATRASPESITARTPSIVMEVSATLVATTTLRSEVGRTARSCSAGDSSPYSGSSVQPRAAVRLPMASMVRMIS